MRLPKEQWLERSINKLLRLGWNRQVHPLIKMPEMPEYRIRLKEMMVKSALLASVVLLLLLWLLISLPIHTTSMVIDEGMHLASGYSILRTSDYRLIEEHPPFVKVWIALPLIFVNDVPDPRTLPAWKEAQLKPAESTPLLAVALSIITSYQPIDRLVFPARTMAAQLALLLGAVVYRWAADLGGKRVGLLALFLLALDPNILAHSAVAGTDLGAAFTTTLSLFLFARWLHRPTILRLVVVGVALGIALGTKISCMLIVPVVLMLGILVYPQRSPVIIAILLGTAGLTLWALYGFEIAPLPGTDILFPAASHLIPFLRLRQHIADGHSAFLMGETRQHGWWYYFPIAFALKTPLPVLMLLLLSCVSLTLRLSSSLPHMYTFIRRWGPLLFFPLLYGLSVLFSPINIGYRHLLPVLPSIFIIISVGITRIPLRNLRSGLFLLGLTWLGIGTLRIAPHYLAYFNELAGGTDNGWRFLAGSNTDWGQGYKDLARFQREHELEEVYLSAFLPTYDPAIYGVVYKPLTPMWGTTPPIFPSRFSPPPGDYVISATTLDGIPLVDPEMYDWFRKREPDARIAHVLFYYRVPHPDPPPEWVAQCAAPLAPLTPEAIAEGFGRDDLRLAEWDCTQAWLYPGGGRHAGWYVLPRDPALETAFTQTHLRLSRLSYEQKRRGALPPFQIYEWEARTSVLDSVVLRTPEGNSAPLFMDGPLAFWGARVYYKTDSLEVETWWQVTEGPITRPLSIIGHLLNGASEMVSQNDGLGVSPVIWQRGDILVQRHRFPLPLEREDLWLRTGVYWLDTMERWPIVEKPNLDMIFIKLPDAE